MAETNTSPKLQTPPNGEKDEPPVPSSAPSEAPKPERDIDESQNIPSPPQISSLAWGFAFAGLGLAAFLYGLDTTIAADIQGSAYATFKEISKIPWIGIGFPMGSVSIILIMGKLYNNFDTKWLIIGSILLFEIGSAVCGAAPTADALIVGRVIAGMGGAGMYLGMLNYIATFTTLKTRAAFNAGAGVCWGIGVMVGPAIGGAFADSSATWRWAFYINLPLAAVFSPIFFWFFPRYNPRPNVPFLKKLLALDWVGAVLNVCMIVFFMIVLNFAGSQWAWDSAPVIVFWILFGLSLIGFIIQQGFCLLTTPDQRLFPVYFLRRIPFIQNYIVTAASITGAFVPLYYIPILFQFTRHDDAIDAAVRVLPLVITFVAFVMVAGATLPMVGRVAPYTIIGGIFLTVGSSLFLTVTAGTTEGAIYTFEVLMGVGVGLVGQNAYAVLAAKVQGLDEVSDMIGFVNFAQIGTIAISLSIASSIFQNTGVHNLAEALKAYNFSEAELRSALAGVESVILSQGSPEVRKLAISAIVKTMVHIFAMSVAGGAVVLIDGLTMKWEWLQLDPSKVSGAEAGDVEQGSNEA